MGKSKKGINSCLALLLTAVTAFLCPLQVAATADATDEPVVTQSQEITETEPEILYEIKSERDEYTKHFKLDDGSLMAVQYNSPVHYLDSDGNWKEYDNTMQDAVNGNESDDEKPEYENKSSDIDIKLSKKSKENNMFKVKNDDYQLSWGYIDTNKSTVEFVDDTTQLTGNDEFLYSENLVQEALYRNIYDNVDLDCYITSTGIKENLILQNAEAQAEFTVSYKINGLSAVQNGADSILLKSGDEVVYVISAPFVQDASGVESDKVTLSIVEQNNNELTVKVTIDSEWLKSGEVSFPVTVDPELTVGESLDTVTTASLVANEPDTATKRHTSFFVGGSDGVSNIHKGIVKINQLPELKNSDRIVNASVRLAPVSELPEMTIFSHEVTTDWNNDNATWNSVGYSSATIDYNTCESGSFEALSFDITKTARKWYDGSLNNYGILFESNSANCAAFGGYDCFQNDKIPALCITYKNYNGTESSLSYHTNNVGANTTTSVCDYTGSMLVNQLIVSGTGNRMPVSITATYNSFDSDKVFANGSPCGYGWQFSFNRYIAATSRLLQDNGYDYVYTDGDGTEHYFAEKTYEEGEETPAYTEWEDEDGLGFTLWFEESYAYMTDGSDVVTKYELPENGGKILSEKDEYNNEIVYSYADGKLASIQDGAGRIYTLAYSVNTDTQKTRVSQITMPDGTSVCFNYYPADKDKLSSVDYKDSSNNVYDRTSFAYNQNNMIEEISAFDEAKIGYKYNSIERITKVTEYGADGSVGNYINIVYSNDNTTTFTDKQGRSQTYTFDNAGNCVSVLNPDGSISSSSGGEMSISGVSESYTHNYIASSNNPNSTYFPQGNGSIGGNESAGGSVTYDNSTEEVDGESVQYFGNKSIKVTNSGEGQFYTYAKQTVDESGLTGKDITLSAYVKTSGITNMNLAEQSGALLSIKFIGSNGSLISQYNSVAVPYDSKWQRISVTQAVPSGTANIEANMVLYNAQGSAWFDCIQLEEGSCMNDYNAMSNSDFTENHSWNGPYQFNGTATNECRLSQSMRVNKKNVSFTALGTAQANSVPLRDNRKFGIMLTLVYNDQSTEDHYAEFNYATAQEQSVSLSVMPEKQNVVIHTVYFRFVYDYNVGTMTPLNSMLNIEYLNDYYAPSEEETGEETEADTTATEESTEEETFDTTPYVGSHSTYDEYGNVTSSAQGTIIPSEDGNDTLDTSKEHIITHTTYDSTGNYAVSESDQRGNVYSYDVNSLNGRTNSVTDARNNTTSYTYDAAGNVTSVSSGNSSNFYTYSANKLTGIGHNGMSYSFAYNSFGNIVSTRVGNTPLISHTYESGNGKLEGSVYGNGDEMDYTYDSLGRIIALANNSEVLASYTYNKKSQITRIVDYSAGLTTDFEYSPSGSCIGKSKYSSDLSSSYYEYETTDENGNTVKTTVVDGTTKTVTDSTDETGNYVLNNGGWSLTPQSDDFGRKLTDSTLISEDKKFTTEYTYVDGANPHETTELIESITHKYGDTVIAKYSYTYDENGNILTVSEDDAERYVYTYDRLNQLTNVVDKKSAVRYFYTYDNAGNIMTSSGQMWNTDSNTAMGSPSTTTYTYGDSNWKDLLTKYKNSEITYDEVGNPIDYRDGMKFTWQNGRQLATLTKNDKTTSYSYDISGIRTQKSIDGTVTKYYYDDSNNLVSMTVGDKKLMFYYDANGSVSSVQYNNAMYYYVKNLQGDITRIVDENGNIVAIYSYDHQGKPTTMRKPSNTDVDIVSYNPFLYRGYVYDSDSGLYYLQSRYYDPVTGRFINADMYCDTGTGVLGTNMFAYCENNQINNVDSNGYSQTYIRAPLRNRFFMSIINSGLINKKGSVFNSGENDAYFDSSVSYTGCTYKDGYEIFTYTKMLGLKQFQQSEYYALRKKKYEWNNYINDNWGFLVNTKRVMGNITEFLSYHPYNPYVSNISGILNFFLTNWIPKPITYFDVQMSVNKKERNHSILICVKVVNKKYSVYYDKKSKKNKTRCFEIITHYAYW
ncbi:MULTISPECIES: DNRLRE domain-containing protein [unclassified Ruminococcus]|uniref:DNRLRE domain-containing protein n=1 Tax=unclassified Ruminococcus TaxID=2608920 RepID=UPI00210DE3FC|nr:MULTISPECIES: DNRLRE domain-containing protein [unclassified Ruminococcus]MCQ4023228.1 DNRLRE domain-containing protein [Ruminococcus sp. zg-924]MCQ4115609.1 DNRLRE domain-containing protein [Ruminococcus sp. zg-921]